MPVVSLNQVVLLFTSCWVIWRSGILKRFFAKSLLHNIPGPPSPSFWTGNLPQLFDANAWDFHQKISEKYGGIMSINSFLGGKQLYIFDPAAMYNIMVKDQFSYERSPLMMGIGGLTIGQGLLNATGEQHRRQRKMLTPIFSAAHMRQMIPIFHEITHKLRATLTLKLAQGSQEIDMLEWVARTALELVGQAGLGFSFDPLTIDGPVHEYSRSMKDLVPTVSRMQLAGLLVFPWGLKVGPPRLRRFIVDIFPWALLHKARDLVDVMYGTTSEIYRGKRIALAEGDEAVARQVGRGKDIIGILMKENDDATEEDRLPESEVIDQMSTLVFAAMDTTSGALARILHLLAKHPDVQDKLRKEIVEARKQHNDIPYNELVSLPYMDAICRETLRLYPPIPTVLRTTCRDTVLPLANPIKGIDGNDIHEIPIPRNSTLIVSLMASNRNPSIWGPDVLEWKPERWLSPLPESVKEAHIPGVYSNLMTFLSGSRSCIGFKFSQLEMKAVLSGIIDRFQFSLTDKEINWEMSLVTSPSVKTGNGSRASMPLKVTLV